MTKTQTATNKPTLPKDGLSRFNDIRHLIPMSRSTVWRMVKQGKFPKPTRITSHCTVWKNSEVLAWIEQQGGNHV